MIESQILKLAQEALQLALTLSAPVVLAAVVFGIAIGILQAATQVQEQSLSTGVRLVVVHVLLVLLGGWMLSSCVAFLQRALLQVANANL